MEAKARAAFAIRPNLVKVVRDRLLATSLSIIVPLTKKQKTCHTHLSTLWRPEIPIIASVLLNLGLSAFQPRLFVVGGVLCVEGGLAVSYNGLYP